MRRRGRTAERIDEAINDGERYPAVNRINPSGTATRYVHPITGQSVVVDDLTGEVLHVGGPGFRY
jgi:hypothetical protein